MKRPLAILNRNKIKTSLLILFIILQITCIQANAQSEHPHILVKPADKAFILQKIEKETWAKKVYDDIVEKVTPYVERHKTDPEWILSRYLMNRIHGKRYTRFISDDDGTELVGYDGDAPYPTVRVSPHKRPPITADNYSYRFPSIEELVPNDTSMKMLLQRNAPDKKKEWVNPQSFVEKINGNINQLALDAAIVFWLTGKEEYAKFSADILSQWARGAFYQNPIEGPCRTGFLSIQTLGDGNYETLTLAYDFLYNYIHKNNYETKWYENVFEKIAHTMTFRGFWNNNWFAAQTPAMVFAALSLEDKKRRDYYLNFYLNKDTISGSCGHLALPSVVSKWLTPDGHWKEPGGYHNFPVSSLLVSGVAMEKNGYSVFRDFPALLQASYVMLKYSFPNFSAPSIGDTGPVSQSPECLELGLVMAKKYNDPLLPQLTAAMDVLINKKGYKRSSADYIGLLSYLPSIPKNTGITYQWPRSGELDFAKAYVQRNGTDKETGLMYVVQGATYNHNHANGMSMELYGAGTVMGPDPGKGLTYEAPMHVNYYAQWAAHNTVVAGGQSGPVNNFKGGGGTKNMGAIALAAMEPKANNEAISPFCSFTTTNYTEPSTKTKQQRTLAIIRTAPSSGYYVDVFRSAHPKSNEYIYHNVGNSIALLSAERRPLAVANVAFPISQKPFDPPGIREITDTKTTGETNKAVTAVFDLHEADKVSKFMQVLFSAEEGRSFYTGSGPQTNTADVAFRNKPTPTLISRQQGEAWKRPFVAVYEPYIGKDNYTVSKIERIDTDSTGRFTAMQVENTNGSKQFILQSDGAEAKIIRNNITFKGNFAVIGLADNLVHYLYLGSGSHVSYDGFVISTGLANGSANVIINNKNLEVSCNQSTTILVPFTNDSKAVLTVDGKQSTLPLLKVKSGVEIKVPPVINGSIHFQ